MVDAKRKRIAFVATGALAVRAFLAGHIQFLAKTYDITVYCSLLGDDLSDLFSDGTVHVVHMPFERKISLAKDLKSWWLLYRAFCREKFDCVHSFMPKTALLAMTAAFAAGIPVRAHTFTGQIWVDYHGLKRNFFKSIDRIVVAFSTHAMVDSVPQRDFLIANGIGRAFEVLGDGTVSGVDLARFSVVERYRDEVRKALAIPADALVFGYLGRKNMDKGLVDLAHAFSSAKIDSRTYLVLVGPDEEMIDQKISAICQGRASQLRLVGATRQPEKYLNAFDVFCLPSYREGLPMTILEAAACGVPAMGSRIYGIEAAVEDGKTGLLHAVRDVAGIQHLIERLAGNPPLRKVLAGAGEKLVKSRFSRQRLQQEFATFYKRNV